MTIETRGAADQRETRFMRSGEIEIRAAEDGQTVKVSGYAAVFDEETVIMGYFRETIRRGAFAEAIARGDDVTFLINHDGLPLSRTASKTLTIREDSKGLFMESTLDAADPDVMRILPKMKRGDLSKMSFAFCMYPGGEMTWTEKDGDELDLREIKKVGRLYDVSIVTEPAYAGTEIALRSRDALRASAPGNANAVADLRRRMTLGLAARRNG